MSISGYRDRLSGNYPMTLDQVRMGSPVLFGNSPDAAALEAAGVDAVMAVDPPAYDSRVSRIEEAPPQKDDEGNYRQRWVITDLPNSVRFAQIDEERDRRLNGGMKFGGVTFQTDDKARERIDRSRMSALAAVVAGAQEGDLQWHGMPVDFFWIAADDSRMPMDAQKMVAFGNAVAAREGMLIVAGNDLKLRIGAGQKIFNVGDDALWPPA